MNYNTIEAIADRKRVGDKGALSGGLSYGGLGASALAIMGNTLRENIDDVNPGVLTSMLQKGKKFSKAYVYYKYVPKPAKAMGGFASKHINTIKRLAKGKMIYPAAALSLGLGAIGAYRGRRKAIKYSMRGPDRSSAPTNNEVNSLIKNDRKRRQANNKG